MKVHVIQAIKLCRFWKQNEAGTPVPNLCREHGMRNATFYKWRSKFGGMDASLMKSSRPRLLGRPLKKYPIKRGGFSGKAIPKTIDGTKVGIVSVKPISEFLVLYFLSAKPVIATKPNYRLKTKK